VVVGILVDLACFPPREHFAASIAIAALYCVWSLGLLVSAWRDALPSWGVWTVPLVDLPVLTLLLTVSGSLSDPAWASPFTDDAFLLVPILAAFQLRPA
jgi:two-component system NarL family sensor kinase